MLQQCQVRTDHLIHSQYPEVPYSNMLFFLSKHFSNCQKWRNAILCNINIGLMDFQCKVCSLWRFSSIKWLSSDTHTCSQVAVISMLSTFMARHQTTVCWTSGNKELPLQSCTHTHTHTYRHTHLQKDKSPLFIYPVPLLMCSLLTKGSGPTVFV